MQQEIIMKSKNELGDLDIQELYTAAEVDNLFANHRGTMLVFINSACGCAARVAHPALKAALQHPHKPEKLSTIFATTERDATARARAHFTNQPPSSPSFAMMRDGKFVEMIPRAEIESSEPEIVASLLNEMFDRHCVNDSRDNISILKRT